MNIQRPLYPFVWFGPVDLDVANECLTTWAHKMGPFTRPAEYGAWAHALVVRDEPVAITVAATLIRATVGGGLSTLSRDNTVELARLCAVRSGLCRVALRMWREFVFPTLGYPTALSYQDADLHNGDTYRFDGWKRVAFIRGGNVDQRSGRKARNKYVWLWPELPALECAA